MCGTQGKRDFYYPGNRDAGPVHSIGPDGPGCLTILRFVGCGMMGAGKIVAVDRAAGTIRAEKAKEAEKSP